MRRPGASSGKIRLARPSSVSSSSCGRSSHRRRLPSSFHACSAGTSRLGSSVDWNRNSSRHDEPADVSRSSVSVSVSVNRNVALAGPTMPVPTPSHGRNARASASSSSGSASNRPCGPVSAVNQSSTAGRRVRRPRRGGARSIRGNAARTAASTIPSNADTTSSCGSCPPRSARHTGGRWACGGDAAVRQNREKAAREQRRDGVGPIYRALLVKEAAADRRYGHMGRPRLLLEGWPVSR